MKKRIISILALSWALVCSVPAGAAATIFLDTFETHPTGNVPAEAEIGRWVVSPVDAAVVNNVIAGSDTQTLRTLRALGGVSPDIRGFAPTLTAYEPGFRYVITSDFYMSNWYHSCGFTMQPPGGHGGVEAGWMAMRFGSPLPTYRYIRQLGGSSWAWTDTGVPVVSGQWVTMEIVMDIVESQTAGYVTGTYSMYMTPQGGTRVTLVEDIALRDIFYGGTIRFGIGPDAPEDYEWGGDVINYWDNISIVKDQPVCGDENHPYPEADLTGDCVVDLADLAVITQHWLDCTDPTCN